MNKGAVIAAANFDRDERKGYHAPQLPTPFDKFLAASKVVPQGVVLSDPISQAMHMASRLTPKKAEERINFAKMIASHDLKLAVTYLGCRVPRPNASGRLVRGERCKLLFCSSCTGTRSRQLRRPLSQVLVEAGHAGRRIEVLVLTQCKCPQEDSIAAYRRLDRELTPRLRWLKGRNRVERVDLMSLNFEDVIDEHGDHHLHAHLIIAWQPSLAEELVNRFVERWRLEIGHVRRVPMFHQCVDFNTSLRLLRKHVSYHRKSNLSIPNHTEKAVASLVDFANKMRGVKFRRPVWMETGLNMIWRPTLGMGLVSVEKDKLLHLEVKVPQS